MRVSDSEAKNHIGHPHFIGPPGRSEQLALDLLDSRAEIARLNGVIEGKDARIKGAEDQAHIEWEEAERLTAALESVAAARRLDEAHIIASTALEANPEGEGLLRGKLASQAEEIERLRGQLHDLSVDLEVVHTARERSDALLVERDAEIEKREEKYQHLLKSIRGVAVDSGTAQTSYPVRDVERALAERDSEITRLKAKGYDAERSDARVKELEWQVANWERKEIDRASDCHGQEQRVERTERALQGHKDMIGAMEESARIRERQFAEVERELADARKALVWYVDKTDGSFDGLEDEEWPEDMQWICTALRVARAQEPKP